MTGRDAATATVRPVTRETHRVEMEDTELIEAEAVETEATEDAEAKSQEAPAVEAAAETEGESDEVQVSLGDEVLTDPEPETDRAPEWVRDLRKQHRELQRKVREYEAREQAAPSAQTVPKLGAKPTLEAHDYDTEKYETALEAWYKQRDAVEAARRESERQEAEQKQAWQARIDDYGKAKAALKVRDYEEAEATVQESLSTVQQGVILQGADNPALIVYALGKNPKKAKELASIQDPVKFAFQIAKMEAQLKVTPKAKPPAPEKALPVGTAPVSATADSTLEKLRAEAERTGDMTKVIRYKQQMRDKQARG